jgi:putative SOS response-associated peptidase YedK
MCGRYRLSREDLEKAAKLTGTEPDFLRLDMAERYNIAPMQRVPVIRSGEDTALHLQPMQWGLLPFWAKERSFGAKTINARSETVADKPAFRDSFAKRRCLVPASGYYEWETVGKNKQPWHFGHSDGSPMMFAGLWSMWTPSGEEPVESFTILTTTPNAFTSRWHDRMPVILPEDTWANWIDGAADDVAGLLNAEQRRHI